MKPGDPRVFPLLQSLSGKITKRELARFCRSAASLFSARMVLLVRQDADGLSVLGRHTALPKSSPVLDLLRKYVLLGVRQNCEQRLSIRKNLDIWVLPFEVGKRQFALAFVLTRKLRTNEKGLVGIFLRLLQAGLQDAKPEDTDDVLLHRYNAFVQASTQGIYRVEVDPPISTRLAAKRQARLFFDRARIAESNRAMLNMYGFSKESEFVGKFVREMLPPDDPYNFQYIQDFIANQYRVHNQESREVDASGKPKFFLNSAFGILRDGQFIGVWGTQQDVTEQKQSLQALQSSEARYRQLVESFWEAIFITDYEGSMLFTNPAVSRVTGYDHARYGSEEFLHVHEEDRNRVRLFVEAFIRSPDTYSQTIENRFINRDGSIRWHSSVISKVSFNNIPALQFIVRDITAAKEAEREISENRANLLAILENTHDAIWSVDASLRLVVANSASQRMFLSSGTSLLLPGMNVLSAAPRSRRDVWRERYAKALKGHGFSVEDHVERHGAQTDFEITFSPILTPQGEIYGVGVIARDVTERRRAQDLVAASERYYRALIENAMDIIIIINADAHILYSSPSVQRVLGYAPDAIQDHCVFDYAHPDEQESLKRVFYESIHSRRRVVDQQYRFRHKNGRWRLLAIHGRNLLRDPIVHGAVINARDVTDRMEAERALRHSEKRYRNLVESMYEFLIEVSLDGRVLFVNQSLLRFCKYRESEVLGRAFVSFVHPEDRERMTAAYNRILTKGQAASYECRFLKRDGSFLHVLVSGDALRDEQGNMTSVLHVLFDITERKQSELQLAAEKERLSVTLRSIGDGVIATDAEGRVRIMNAQAEQFTGWTSEEGMGQRVSEVVVLYQQKNRERLEDTVQRTLRSNTLVETTRPSVLAAKGGREFIVTETASPIRDAEGRVIGAVLVIHDITEKQKLEEERVKALKLESVGILAGGIAHDFNNILTAILGNISLAKMEIAVGRMGSLSDMLSRSEKACLRARDLTQQLLTFSRGGVPVRHAASIGELIKESAEFVVRGSGVLCEFAIDPDLWLAQVDTGQINQVIHNLVLNAVQAMPNGGTVTIQAENVDANSNPFAGLQPGRYVCIRFRDQGSGIPADVMPKIFDPYFTTKSTGSGLGLAMCYSIVKNHDGLIAVESEINKGTTFSVFLPASAGARSESELRTKVEFRGQGRILIMDDEPDIRTLLIHMVGQLGYDAVAVSEGDDAIREYVRAMSEGTPYRLVIMDLTIPGGKGGKETMEELLRIDPEVCAVVASGYSNDPVMADCRTYGFRGVIRKPFSMEDVTETLRSIRS